MQSSQAQDNPNPTNSSPPPSSTSTSSSTSSSPSPSTQVDPSQSVPSIPTNDPSPPPNHPNSNDKDHQPPTDPETTLDLSSSDLALALEPFGYGINPSTGRRSTTMRELPEILRKFQDSRETLYFTPALFQEIERFAAINPDMVAESEDLNFLLQSAKHHHSGLDPHHPPSSSPIDSSTPYSPSDDPQPTHPLRIRSAESPSSSNGDRAQLVFGSQSPSPIPSPSEEIDHPLDHSPDHSFHSHLETTLTPTIHHPGTLPTNPPSDSPSQSADHTSSTSDSPFRPFIPPQSTRSDRHRSVPIGYGSTPRSRPRPPNRRKKISSVDLKSKSPSSLGHPIPHLPAHISHHSSPDLHADPNNYPSDSHHTPDRTSATACSTPDPSPPISTDPQAQDSSYLTPNNLSQLIFQNRQRGLYDFAEDHLQESDRISDSPEGDSNPNDIISRIRSNPLSRPTSKVYTRIFDSEVGTDPYPSSSADEIQSFCEDYPALVRSCEELRLKNKDLVNRIVGLEKIHENEIIKLTDQVEEMKQELSICKKSEKELTNMTSKLRFQLSDSDDRMGRMNKEISSLQDNCHKLKQQWDVAVEESERLMRQLSLKEEELRYANQNIQSHASDLRKWESDRQLHEGAIKKLNIELLELQSTRDILEEQKQANLELKTTIDKLKFELEEQRTRYAGSSVANSRPSSIAGSLSKSLGAELAQLSGIDDLKTQGEYDDDDGDLSDTTADDTDEIRRIVQSLSDPHDATDGSDIYEEIRIKRIKRRKTMTPGNKSVEIDGTEGNESTSTIEEVIDLQDVSTDTQDLITYKSSETQTDPIPEPPPVYRPKTEDSQVQTDENLSSSERDGDLEMDEVQRSLLKLVAGLDPNVMKSAIDRIQREMTVDQPDSLDRSGRTFRETTLIDDSSSSDRRSSSSSNPGSDFDSDSVSDSDSCSDSEDDPPVNSKGKTSPRSDPMAYFTRWALSAAVESLSILSPYSILNSLPLFGFLRPHDLESPDQERVKVSRRRSKRGNHKHEVSKGKMIGVREGRMKRNLRICSSMIIFLATGYFLGNLIFSPPTNSFVTTSSQCCSSSSGSCLVETLKNSKGRGQYTIGFLSSSSSSLGGGGGGHHNVNNLGGLNTPSTSNHRPNFVPPLPTTTSLINLNSTTFNDLIDFNSIGIGREGFIVQLRHRIGLLIWLKDFGTNIIWNTVSGYPKIPT